MKKVLPAIVLLGFLAFPVLVAADITETPIPEKEWSQEDLYNLIDRIGTIIFTVLLALAGIFLVVAGIFFVTASGNPEQVRKAREMLVNALIGIAVAVAAKGITTLIQNILA